MASSASPASRTSKPAISTALRAVYSERQLQEVMVDFWTNHFNVFAGKGADRWLLPSYDRDTIRPNAMGEVFAVVDRDGAEPGDAFLSRQLSKCQSELQPGQSPPSLC